MSICNPEKVFLNRNADATLIKETLEGDAIILCYKECWRASLALLELPDIQ